VPYGLFSCQSQCNCNAHCCDIDKYYENIVHALFDAASVAVVRIPSNALKPFWNDHLDNLKQESIFWHSLWVSAGRQHTGVLSSIKNSCKAKYKAAIRDAYVQFESAHDDAITNSFLNKDVPQFWKAWNAKFKRNICANIVFNACDNDFDVANRFAEQFASVYQVPAQNTNIVNKTIQRVCAVVTNEPLEQQSHTRDISVELVDKCIPNLKSGKACGIDDIGAEHLLYAHPSVVVHLKLLFAMCMSHGYVPHAFGQGIIIPLVKDKSAACVVVFTKACIFSTQHALGL